MSTLPSLESLPSPEKAAPRASEWRETTLGESTELLTGFPFKSANYTKDESGIALVRGDNVVQGRFRWDDVKRWPENQNAELTDYFLQSGDVILAMDRPWIEAGLKYACVAEEDLPCLLVQRVARLRARNGFNQGFLRYVIGSRAFTDHVLSVQTGTAVPHISGAQIKQFSFRSPPLPEQRAIASVLGALDDKIELNRRMNETLEALAQTLFKSWFVDATQSALPKGWREAKLGEHVEVVKGLSYKGSGLADAGVPLHNLNSIYEGGRYKHEGLKHYTGEYKDRHIIHPGDVIVANTEQGHDYLLIGFPAIVPKCYGKFGLFTHHTYRVRPLSGSPLTNHFIYSALLSPSIREQVIGHTNGTTVNALAKSGIEEATFGLPPAERIAEFERIVAPMFDKQEELHQESRTLAALRDALLPKLLSGELRVPTAAKHVEGIA